MANNKKFIVKNGLLTQENVVIGSVTDNGVNKLQVTGSTKLSGFAEVTQPTAIIPSLNITNSGGFAANSIIAQFTGDADSLRIVNFDNGAYTIRNAGQDNGIRFYNDTDGLDIVYNGNVDVEFNSAGIDFKRDITYLGNMYWNAGNDGANSGLDADLLDGLDSLQFLRSDQDDVMNGSLVINGNLTVTGNTTTVNTEEILLADNIITLNSNYTGSTPSENAGLEVERGTLDNATLTWNETTDKWHLAGVSQGLVLGDSTSLVGDIQSYANSFIIQAGGASGVSNGTTLLSGKRGGTASDSAIAAFWNASGTSYGEVLYNGSPKLRSENTGMVTLGNQRILGSATVGTGSGGAYIYMDGAGNNGTIYSSAGEIGFLNSSLNYALKVDSSGDVRVTDDIYAQRWIDINNNSYLLDLDGTSVVNTVDLEGQIRHNGDTDTYITFPAANQFEVRTGGSQRLLVTDTYTESSNYLRAPRFVDSANTSYYADPASTSVFNRVGIDDFIQHNGNTNTYFGFSADNYYGVFINGLEKLSAYQSFVVTYVDMRSPRFVDANDTSYYADFANTAVSIEAAGTINAANANFYSGTANNTINIGTDVDERLEITTTPSQAYIRYYQDETNATDHSVNFEIVSSGIGSNQFRFNKNVVASGQSMIADYGLFSQGVYGEVFYDYSDENYYADFNNTDVSIKVAGEILAGNGALATPTYSFVNDPNTGMYRYGADILGFSAGGNDEMRIYTTYVQALGSFRAPIFYDTDNTAYYGNFAGTSVMNNIGIDSDIFHNGDTDNKIGFTTDTQTFTTANVARLTINTTALTSTLNTYAPRYYTDDYMVHNGDTNTYIGFNAADTFGVWTNGANRLSVTATAITGSINFVGPRFVDSDNDAYYAEPASTSVFNTLGIDSDLFHNGDTDTKINFTTDTIKLDTAGTTRLTANNTGIYATDIYASNFYGTTQASAPIFYDSDNVNYYADFANTDISIVTAGKVGVGTTGPTAMVDINIPTAMGPNPFAAGNQYLALGDAGTVDLSIAGDNLRNIWTILEASSQFMFADTGANVLLSADAASTSVIVGDQTPTYTTTDANTNFIGTPDGNKLHVNGSLQLSGINNVISIGAAGANTAVNEATFLATNELGFGAGGGFYMNDTATVRVRGNKALSTTGNITAGNMYAARFYDADNNAYYADPASSSVFNTVGIDSDLFHNGDTNTKVSFGTDEITLSTAGTVRLTANTTQVASTLDVYAPRYYDSGNAAYYADPAGTSQFARIDIDDYIRHRGDTNNYFGFAANDTFRVWTGGGQRLNIDNDSADFTVNVYAPRYYDSNDSTYYADPAGFSVLGGANFGVPGNGNTTKGRFISIEGNTDASGEASSRIFFAEHNSTTTSMSNYGMSFGYRGGASSIIGGDGNTWTGLSAVNNGEWGLWGHDNSAAGALAMWGPRSGSYVTATGSFRAPIFYDSNNTAYYIDAASTSVTNTMRANRYQVDGSTYFIDSASGDYGSIRVEGQKNSWAGYAIYDDWVFMSNGASNAGIYNDTRNEWAMQAADNSWTRLYANGVHQIGAENGYGYAPTSMRSPIFYDSDDAAWYGDFASQSKFRDVAVGDQGVLASGYPLTSYDSQRYLFGLRNSTADTSYPWLAHDNKDSISAFIVHFNGIGDRFWIKEDGDAYLDGEMQAQNFLIGTGNEPMPIIKSYGAGTSESKLFDGNLYWEKRAIQALQGSENSATTTTSEYVKSADAPGSSSYVLRSAGYRDFYSDYIEVEPGEEIYGEMWVKFISGSGGLFYYGVERFDKDKRPIASNTGCTYFVAGGSNVTSTSWQKFSGHHTIPTSHTPYNGSDGGGVRYVRIRILMNYNAGGALREFTAPILMRSTVQSRIRTDQNVYAPIYYDSNDNGYYLDPNSVSSLNDVRASIFRDRNNTTYYMDPASGGKLAGTWNFTNGTIDDVNNITFADPGPNEGLQWKGGNDWRIYESPNDLTTNAAGNLQFVTGTTSRGRIDTNGDWWAGRYSYAQRFYDSNNGTYYLDPASTSELNAVNFNGKAIFKARQDDSAGSSTYVTAGVLDEHLANVAAEFWSGNDQPVTIYFRSGVNAPSDFAYITYDPDYDNTGENGALVLGSENDGTGSSDYIRLQARTVVDSNQYSSDNSSIMEWYLGGTRYGLLNTDYFYHSSDIRSPIFYDSNDTNYYADLASTSRTNVIISNEYRLNDGWKFYDDSGTTAAIQSNDAGLGYLWFRQAAGGGVGSIQFFNNSSFGFVHTTGEWGLRTYVNGSTYMYHNGNWQISAENGYAAARYQMRAPIYYDSNNTAYRVDGNGTTRLYYLTVDTESSLNINGYSSYLLRDDNRIIAPSEDPAGRMQFGFTSWNNNNTADYADYLHLRSYTDASGGSDNLVMFKKNGIGMRIWQQSWGSTTAYATYRNVAVYNENPGASNDMYASIYYDSNDTSRYMDPASTSQINNLQINGGNSISLATASGNIRGYIQATETNDAHLIIATSGGEDISFRDGGLAGQWNMIIRGDGNVLTLGSSYAQSFIDRNNTAYYADPASTSVMSVLDVRSEIYNDGWFRNDTSGRGLYNTATAMHWYSDSSTRWRMYSTGNTVEMMMTTSGDTTRGYVYANNSNDIGFLNNSGNWIFRTRQSYAELYGDLYANIMYDRNNSAYYVNPASTTQLNTLYVDDRIYFNGSVSTDDRRGLFFDGGTSEAYAIFREGGGWSNPYPDLRIAFHTGIKLGANAGYNGIRFYNDYTMAGQVMSVNNSSDPLGGNNVYVNNSLQAGSSLRAPIFYDSNNTAYYFNGASDNSTRFRGVQSETMAFMGLSGQTRSSKEYYAARPRITSDTNYWTGSMGWGTIDMNTVGDWGSGFIDSWSNPGNQPSGTSHWVGVQAFHYTNGSSRYGWQMVGGPIENLRFRSSWGGFRTWRTIPVLNVNDSNGGAMYANIYYDTDNTGFYCDPSNFSNFNSGLRATEIYARNWFRNDNSREGIYNQATGVHAYSYQSQYYAITGNNDGSSINVQMRSNYNGTIRLWLHGSTDGWGGFLNTAGAWKLRYRVTDGYSPSLQFREEGDETWTGDPGNDVGKIEYHSNRFYIVSGGNSNRIVQFRQNSADRSYIANDGVFVGTATSARWADLAERYEADAIYEPGTILGINLDGDSEVTLYQPGMPVAGAISTNPAYRMNEHIEYEQDDSIESKMNPFIALKGRIPVKVNGEVRKGQWVIADKDGKGRGVDYGTPGINTYDIIGIAISNSENGEVEVKV